MLSVMDGAVSPDADGILEPISNERSNSASVPACGDFDELRTVGPTMTRSAPFIEEGLLVAGEWPLLKIAVVDRFLDVLFGRMGNPHVVAESIGAAISPPLAGLARNPASSSATPPTKQYNGW